MILLIFSDAHNPSRLIFNFLRGVMFLSEMVFAEVLGIIPISITQMLQAGQLQHVMPIVSKPRTY